MVGIVPGSRCEGSLWLPGLLVVVKAVGFEPTVSRSQTWRATAAPRPDVLGDCPVVPAECEPTMSPVMSRARANGVVSAGLTVSIYCFGMERTAGVEPASSGWKPEVFAVGPRSPGLIGLSKIGRGPWGFVRSPLRFWDGSPGPLSISLWRLVSSANRLAVLRNFRPTDPRG